METTYTANKAIASGIYALLLLASAATGIELDIDTDTILRVLLVASTLGHPLITWWVRNHPK